jgi:thiol-disulfide isomerase/thioredoxin
MSCAAILVRIATWKWPWMKMKLGRLEEALKSCDKGLRCVSVDPVRTATHALKGNILASMGDDPQELNRAESEYRAALQLDASNAIIHFTLGVVLLREEHDPDGIAQLNDYLRFSPGGPNASYARKLIAHPRRAGDRLAPSFSVHTVDGRQISLDELVGKIVVMDFWASWCGPCRESVPELKALTKKYSSSELVLVSFSADTDQQAWKDFLTKHDMDCPQSWDGDGGIRKQFDVNVFPTHLVLDQEGFIRERIVGLNPQLSVVGRLKDTLKAMLPEQTLLETENHFEKIRGRKAGIPAAHLPVAHADDLGRLVPGDFLRHPYTLPLWKSELKCAVGKADRFPA